MVFSAKSILATGTFTNVYLCEDNTTILKVIKDTVDNKRLIAEAEIVTQLRKTRLAGLFPELLDANAWLQECEKCPDRFKCFTASKKIDCGLRNNALLYKYDKDMPSLLEVMNVYPNGIDERDMIWMYKRMLAAIQTAHNEGVVHSAVLPQHVLLNLVNHGICLIDWMHINKVGRKPNINKIATNDYYPDYKLTADNSTALDIHMASVCAAKLIGGVDKASKEIRIILRAGMSGATDALLVHEQMDKVAKKLYGSVFRPFKVK